MVYVLYVMGVIIICLLLFFIPNTKKKRKIDEKEYQLKVQQKEKEIDLYYKNGIERIDQELNNKRKQKEKELEDELILDKEKINNQYNEFISGIEIQKKLKLDNFDLEISKLEEVEKEKRFNILNTEFLEKKNEYLKQFQDFAKQIEDKKVNLTNEYDNLKKELIELKSVREKTIESYKKEQAILEQQDFYRICLSNNDKEDIKILLDIENKITNKEAINKLIYDVYVRAPANELMLRIIGNSDYSGIYKITHIPSQKVYIGKSVHVKARLIEHIKGAYHLSSIADQEIHRAMEQEGIDNFTFEIIEKVDKDRLTDREHYWIDYYKAREWGYNKVN